MHRSSETVGSLAAALARAQQDLRNPERSLTALIPATSPREQLHEGPALKRAQLFSGRVHIQRIGRIEAGKRFALVVASALCNNACARGFRDVVGRASHGTLRANLE
jgi:hypothetical protein